MNKDANIAPQEVKPSFSWRYFALTAIVAIVPSAISGVAGYYFNEYTRDRKVIDVSSTSSGNLVSIPVNIGENLEVLFPVNSGRKEPVKSLVRYDIRLTNKTEQGVDDLSVFIEPPKGIELTTTPVITTNPPELRNAISVETSIAASGNPILKFNLLNPGQTINMGFFGFSQTDVVTGNLPLTAVISKKDWIQRSDVKRSYAEGGVDLYPYGGAYAEYGYGYSVTAAELSLIISNIVLLVGIFLIAFILVYRRRV